MFCRVWVNISPVQLTARGQSCNLRLSTACIQRANIDVPRLSVCMCECVCAAVCIRQGETEKEGERERKQVELEDEGTDKDKER